MGPYSYTKPDPYDSRRDIVRPMTKWEERTPFIIGGIFFIPIMILLGWAAIFHPYGFSQ